MKRGYVLQKSRSRTPEVPSYGMYRLVDPDCNTVVFGAETSDYSASLEEVQDYLATG